MVSDCFSVMQNVVIILLHEKPSRRGLLVCHRDCALISRPASAITRVKRVENFSRKILNPELIKPKGVRFTKPGQALPLRSRQIGIKGSRFRREKVSRVRPHFVEINQNGWREFKKRLPEGKYFGLCGREPITI